MKFERFYITHGDYFETAQSQQKQYNQKLSTSVLSSSDFSFIGPRVATGNDACLTTFSADSIYCGVYSFPVSRPSRTIFAGIFFPTHFQFCLTTWGFFVASRHENILEQEKFPCPIREIEKTNVALTSFIERICGLVS